MSNSLPMWFLLAVSLGFSCASPGLVNEGPGKSAPGLTTYEEVKRHGFLTGDFTEFSKVRLEGSNGEKRVRLERKDGTPFGPGLMLEAVMLSSDLLLYREAENVWQDRFENSISRVAVFDQRTGATTLTNAGRVRMFADGYVFYGASEEGGPSEVGYVNEAGIVWRVPSADPLTHAISLVINAPSEPKRVLVWDGAETHLYGESSEPLFRVPSRERSAFHLYGGQQFVYTETESGCEFRNMLGELTLASPDHKYWTDDFVGSGRRLVLMRNAEGTLAVYNQDLALLGTGLPADFMKLHNYHDDYWPWVVPVSRETQVKRDYQLFSPLTKSFIWGDGQPMVVRPLFRHSSGKSTGYGVPGWSVEFEESSIRFPDHDRAFEVPTQWNATENACGLFIKTTKDGQERWGLMASDGRILVPPSTWLDARVVRTAFKVGPSEYGVTYKYNKTHYLVQAESAGWCLIDPSGKRIEGSGYYFSIDDALGHTRSEFLAAKKAFEDGVHAEIRVESHAFVVAAAQAYLAVPDGEPAPLYAFVLALQQKGVEAGEEHNSTILSALEKCKRLGLEFDMGESHLMARITRLITGEETELVAHFDARYQELFAKWEEEKRERFEAAPFQEEVVTGGSDVSSYAGVPEPYAGYVVPTRALAHKWDNAAFDQRMDSLQKMIDSW